MTLVSTPVTNNLYRDYNSLPLKQENNLEIPKPYNSVSALPNYGLAFENVLEEDSDEVVEIIHDSNFWNIRLYQLSNPLFAGISWESWKEFFPFRETETSPTTDVSWERIYKNIILGELFDEFDALSLQEDNWDGYGSKKPNGISLDNARRFVEEFYDVIVSERQPWFTPLISSNEDGYITAEWYGEERQLHLLVEEEDVVYIQVWGPNIDSEMHVDTFHNKDYLTLWKWLFDE